MMMWNMTPSSLLIKSNLDFLRIGAWERGVDGVHSEFLVVDRCSTPVII